MATDDIDRSSRAGAGVVLGAGSLVALAALLPWVDVSTVYGTQIFTGMESPDGQWVLLIGGVIAASGLQRLTRHGAKSWEQVVPSVAALGAGYIGWWHFQYAQNQIGNLSVQYQQYIGTGQVRPTIGIGLYLIVVGGVATILGASTQGQSDRESLNPLPLISFYEGAERFLGYKKEQADLLAWTLGIDPHESYSYEFYIEIRDRFREQGS
ncbi:MAG TPA: hypothetical protein VGP04_13555 [Pseudonocardiaceae bacterium]|nr:hypothetical protein [Pseudonocardiaceae bacterium]